MVSTRPSTLVVVAGTGTEVGKTWVAVRLIEQLVARGVTVAARKPAQSFEADDPSGSTDAGLLAAASGEPLEVVCPPHRWYPTPMAPPMAADSLGRGAVTLDDLVDEVADSWPRPTAQVGLVELAGGLWSPAAHDGDGIELTRRLGPDQVLLVADAGLGTLNAVRPALRALAELAAPNGPLRVTVLLNRFDETVELHRRNAEWLRAHEQIEAHTTVEEISGGLVTLD